MFANSIAGPREVLKSNNCQNRGFLFTSSSWLITKNDMDGGYFVQVNQKYILISLLITAYLFGWKKCVKVSQYKK